MTRLPSLTPRQVLRALRRAGFVQVRVKGSHYFLEHPERPGFLVTVPFHRKDLPRGTLGAIIEEAGLTVDRFVELL